VLIACWSVKGGSGTTVVASTLALLLARSGTPVRLVDLGGDVPAALGLAEPSGPGVWDFVAAGPGVPPDSLGRLCTPSSAGLEVLHAGDGSPAEGTAEDGERLAAALQWSADEAAAGTTVVDCGPPSSPVGDALAGAASLSLLVMRPCYLALRRAARAAIRPSGVILVKEPGRSIGEREVMEVLGVPVRAEVPLDPAIARVVDAGLLASRVPRSIERSLRVAA
jgi:MinD superfamily P-loop ATPase